MTGVGSPHSEEEVKRLRNEVQVAAGKVVSRSYIDFNGTSVYVHAIDENQDWSHGSKNSHVFVFVIEGKLNLKVEDKQITLVEGDGLAVVQKAFIVTAVVPTKVLVTVL